MAHACLLKLGRHESHDVDLLCSDSVLEVAFLCV